jgi:hypothetical protein
LKCPASSSSGTTMLLTGEQRQHTIITGSQPTVLEFNQKMQTSDVFFFCQAQKANNWALSCNSVKLFLTLECQLISFRKGWYHLTPKPRLGVNLPNPSAGLGVGSTRCFHLWSGRTRPCFCLLVSQSL